VIALGYKGEHIKKYFADYCSLGGDVLVDFNTRRIATNGDDLDWTVNWSKPGSRRYWRPNKRLASHVAMGPLCSPGVTVFRTSILHKLLEFHQSHGKLATLDRGATRGPLWPSRPRRVQDHSFLGKTANIRGLDQRSIFRSSAGGSRYIEVIRLSLRKSLWKSSRGMAVMAFQHESFWQCMDTLREKQNPQTLWNLVERRGRCGEDIYADLLTGHKGYIGVVLVQMLLEAGHEVHGLDSDLFRRCTFVPRRQPSRDCKAFETWSWPTSRGTTQYYIWRACPMIRLAI